ncbi:MAG: right-handed parallel beta-helix repeat-containing protein [Verrucomicrobia bacterium]|nr:right-handed parallel beta-helix repeat-containing protein [Verrucomicrobiota bacterium]
MNRLRFWTHFKADCIRLFPVTALMAGLCQSAVATALYVNPGGVPGHYATIGAAVKAAAAGDTIYVSPGVYNEGVVIGTSLSLVGSGRGRSIINAAGRPNGIYIDGKDNNPPGLSRVVVTGFTIENARFEGILVTDASFVTIWDNEVSYNDQALNVSGNLPACSSDLPGFETEEGEDCGEGIHLIGVDHSVVANNISQNNSGGILLSDETGATHHNLITKNLVRDNPFDCGITLASHPLAPGINGSDSFGVFNNTIAHNDSIHNGHQVPGAGAGVGIFAAGPGNRAYANVVIDNDLTNNGLPGVTMHNHAAPGPGDPAVNLNDNVITNNRISGNAADTEDAATPGPTGINVFGRVGITGTLISGNVIYNEQDDIVTNTPAKVDAHLNDLVGAPVGLANIGPGTVDATENWWGSPSGPGTRGATAVSGSGVNYTPWLIFPIPFEVRR